MDSLAPTYYCPGCGARYFGPGVCTNEHQAIQLDQIPVEPSEKIAGDHPAAGDTAPTADALPIQAPPAAAATPLPEAPPLTLAAEIPPNLPTAEAVELGGVVSELHRLVEHAHALVARIEQTVRRDPAPGEQHNQDQA